MFSGIYVVVIPTTMNWRVHAQEGHQAETEESVHTPAPRTSSRVERRPRTAEGLRERPAL